MKSNGPASRGTEYFCFADPAGFSGQKAAMELVMNGLAQRGWLCRSLPLPVLDRTGGGFPRLRHFMAMFLAWLRAAQLLFARGSGLWLGLGQTRASFVRDAIPVFFGRLGLGRSRIVLSLNGSLFMHWEKNSLDASMFRFLLKQAGIVTVVGEGQRARLIAWGVPASQVHVVVNSCDMAPSSALAVREKHAGAAEVDAAVHCLFLSSLIDTKGYPEYIEALHRLSTLAGPRVEAVLCGRLVLRDFRDRFSSVTEAGQWIEREMSEINRGARVRVRWVKGAKGADKAALFRGAHLFVLPTRYAVEAQPLVLLEAMASGCAIITTRAGEIPTILDERSAVFLREPTTDALVDELQALVADSATRARLANAAHTRYLDCYQIERHLDQWEKLLNPSGKWRVRGSRRNGG